MKNTESYQLSIDAARAYRFGCAALEVRKENCTAYHHRYESKYNHFATIYHFAIILQMLMLNRNLIWLQ